MLVCVFFTIIYLALCNFSINGEESKRLLVNDPNAVQNMLHEYEIKLQGYQALVQQLQQEVTALKGNQNEVQQLRQEVVALKGNQTQVQQLQKEVAALKGSQNIVHRLQQSFNELKVGSTYVRWGRKTCPTDNNTEIVYDGIVGGSEYGHKGAAVDYLCLPHNPDNTINPSSITLQGVWSALLYGAEYQFIYGNVRIDDDVPCAVCRVRQASSVLMIPAKSSCPQDWKKQYSGLLSSSYYDFPAASQYVCLDGHPEYLEGTRSHDDNGKLFYPVKTVCGSLPCPPYVNDSIVECVVCTK